VLTKMALTKRFDENNIPRAWRLMAATGTMCLLFVPDVWAAETGAQRAGQNNPCAIFGSGYVAEKSGGCARIGGRVRVERNIYVRQRTEIVPPPLAQPPMGLPGGLPGMSGFTSFGAENGDGPSRAHLRLPGETMGNAFAPRAR
jgi:hypothetical protein